MAKNKLIIQRAILTKPTGNLDSSCFFDEVKCSSKVYVEFKVICEIASIVVPEYQEVID